ncbi:hypothetical protein ADUPG1_013121, partial [Aduncisulcus paluster]
YGYYNSTITIDGVISLQMNFPELVRVGASVTSIMVIQLADDDGGLIISPLQSASSLDSIDPDSLVFTTVYNLFLGGVMNAYSLSSSRQAPTWLDSIIPLLDQFTSVPFDYRIPLSDVEGDVNLPVISCDKASVSSSTVYQFIDRVMFHCDGSGEAGSWMSIEVTLLSGQDEDSLSAVQTISIDLHVLDSLSETLECPSDFNFLKYKDPELNVYVYSFQGFLSTNSKTGVRVGGLVFNVSTLGTLNVGINLDSRLLHNLSDQFDQALIHGIDSSTYTEILSDSTNGTDYFELSLGSAYLLTAIQSFSSEITMSEDGESTSVSCDLSYFSTMDVLSPWGVSIAWCESFSKYEFYSESHSVKDFDIIPLLSPLPVPYLAQTVPGLIPIGRYVSLSLDASSDEYSILDQMNSISVHIYQDSEATNEILRLHIEFPFDGAFSEYGIVNSVADLYADQITRFRTGVSEIDDDLNVASYAIDNLPMTWFLIKRPGGTGYLLAIGFLKTGDVIVVTVAEDLDGNASEGFDEAWPFVQDGEDVELNIHLVLYPDSEDEMIIAGYVETENFTVIAQFIPKFLKLYQPPLFLANFRGCSTTLCDISSVCAGISPVSTCECRDGYLYDVSSSGCSLAIDDIIASTTYNKFSSLDPNALDNSTSLNYSFTDITSNYDLYSPLSYVPSEISSVILVLPPYSLQPIQSFKYSMIYIGEGSDILLGDPMMHSLLPETMFIYLCGNSSLELVADMSSVVHTSDSSS